MNRRGGKVAAGWRCLLACIFILAHGTSLVSGMMQVDLGMRYGLDVSNPNAPMHEGALRQIMDGVRQEKPDAMYLFGLMQFYGHGVTQDKDAAVRFFRKAAADRHADAQFALGLLHYNGGSGVGQDDALAYSFLKPAADKGHADSQWLLGTMLRDGRGLGSPGADATAFELIQKSARQGNPHGQFHLGVYYEYGSRHVAQNLTAAAQLYTSASAQHLSDAAFYLGLMYAYGRGVPQDVERAVGLFDKAAQKQHGPAMYYLGLMHVHGDGGLPIDYTRGLYWLEKAVATNDASIAATAQHARDELAALIGQATSHRDAVLAGGGHVDL